MKISVSPTTYKVLQALKLACYLGGMGYGGYATTKEPTDKKSFFSEITKLLPQFAQESTPYKACFGVFVGGVLCKIPVTTFSVWAITNMTGKKEIPLTRDIKIKWGS